MGAGPADAAALRPVRRDRGQLPARAQQDVVQVVERLLKTLLGKPRKIARKGRAEKDDSDLIVVAHDLSPADTIQFKNLKIGGFVTDLGGATSHTAIVARSLAIPAVVGLHHARPLIRDDDLLIVDGTRGVLIVNPDERVIEEYRLRKTELELERSKLKRLRTAKASTLDGELISLQANIELPQDIGDRLALGIADLLAAEGLDGPDGDASIRITVYCGSWMSRGLLPPRGEQLEATVVIQAWPVMPAPAGHLEDG